MRMPVAMIVAVRPIVPVVMVMVMRAMTLRGGRMLVPVVLLRRGGFLSMRMIVRMAARVMILSFHSSHLTSLAQGSA